MSLITLQVPRAPPVGRCGSMCEGSRVVDLHVYTVFATRMEVQVEVSHMECKQEAGRGR